MKKFSSKKLSILKQYLNSFHIQKEKNKKLIIILGTLGDFDSIEYIKNIVNMLSVIESANISLNVIGIGSSASKNKFCSYTSLPHEYLTVTEEPYLHTKLELCPGVTISKLSWLNFILMCAGVNSPGTIKEVVRGYLGDRNAPQVFKKDEKINLGYITNIPSSIFNYAGGSGYQRPLEMATFRLKNMIEVLSNWGKYIPNADYLTYRGGTFLLNENDDLLYCYLPLSILGYSETMSKPLNFLEKWI